MKQPTTQTNSQKKPLPDHENLFAQNKIGETYNTIQEGIIEGNVDSFTQAANSASGPGMTILLVGLSFVVIIAGIIETGTIFGVILPSDIILSATVIALIVLKKWWMVLVAVTLSIIFTIVGDQIGYYTGYKLGSKLYNKEDTRYFKKKYLIQAQEALNKRGEKFLYKGRFVAFGGFLPMIYGMMKWDRTRFFKVSALSGALRKLSIIVPLVIVLAIFPSLEAKFVLLIALAAAIPEVIGWIALLLPEFQKYKTRLSGAKDQVDALRGNFSNIVDALNTPTLEQSQALKEREAEQKLQQEEMIKKDKERQRRLEAGDLTLGEKILQTGQQAGGAALSATTKLGDTVSSKVKAITTDKSKEAHPDFQTLNTTNKSDIKSKQIKKSKDIKNDNLVDTSFTKLKRLGSSLGSKAVKITNIVGESIENTTSHVANKAKTSKNTKKEEQDSHTTNI